ncbi:hypothetical protein AB4425_13460 [Vibrio sp. 10N.261.51.A1]|uniref:DUF2441 domain-containing protein n=1 Tax=unclassified Vibrio TaxID=2614977 RepID=UPI002A71E4C1|nr:DUF2441 domain-containing protein [Vibrio crassostreae]
MSKTFYAVDRQLRLSEGMFINTIKYDDITPPFLQEFMNTQFPEGVSVHGELYLIRDDAKCTVTEPIIEILFEYIRQANFTECVSRYQSFFAFETYQEAVFFKNRFNCSSASIYEIHSTNKWNKVNMNLLTLQDSVLSTAYLAHEYWKGNASIDSNPLWECLLSLPVTVGKKIHG